MKRPVVTIIALSMFALGRLNSQTGASQAPAAASNSPQGSQSITITRSGLRQTEKGPAERFTGSVEIEPLFPVHDPSHVLGGSVTFQPGARTAWHEHVLGQILIVTAGTGWVQQWGGPIQEIQKGDVIWIPARVKHWHGATPNTAMTHIAIVELRNGYGGEWFEKVTDEQYRK